jgi:Fe-Mn family superoxide dismutase
MRSSFARAAAKAKPASSTAQAAARANEERMGHPYVGEEAMTSPLLRVNVWSRVHGDNLDQFALVILLRLGVGRGAPGAGGGRFGHSPSPVPEYEFPWRVGWRATTTRGRDAMSQLSRRQALAAAAAGVATLAVGPLSLAAEDKKTAYYALPKLPYGYDALEPKIDAETMKIHHDKHHQAYIDNAKKALAKTPKLLEMPPEKLLSDKKLLDEIPKESRQAAINNVGGHSNHSIFWTIMGPKQGKASKELTAAIEDVYKTFDGFKKRLTDAATSQFGSGWAWLVVTQKKGLRTVQRSNQDSPYLEGLTPILGIDVWEHAYYLKYKNVRGDYVKAWWDVVNWDVVSERYAAATK